VSEMIVVPGLGEGSGLWGAAGDEGSGVGEGAGLGVGVGAGVEGVGAGEGAGVAGEPGGATTGGSMSVPFGPWWSLRWVASLAVD
jgi:hypothetical protein